MPSPRSAGVFGIARTTLESNPSISVRYSMVIPGASEITTCSFVITFSIFLITWSYICGFTARIRYFTLFASSALLSTKRTPVSSSILLPNTLFFLVKRMSSFSNTFNAPFNMAYPMFPIPINPIFAIFSSFLLTHKGSSL